MKKHDVNNTSKIRYFLINRYKYYKSIRKKENSMWNIRSSSIYDLK